MVGEGDSLVGEPLVLGEGVFAEVRWHLGVDGGGEAVSPVACGLDEGDPGCHGLRGLNLTPWAGDGGFVVGGVGEHGSTLADGVETGRADSGDKSFTVLGCEIGEALLDG